MRLRYWPHCMPAPPTDCAPTIVCRCQAHSAVKRIGTFLRIPRKAMIKYYKYAAREI